MGDFTTIMARDGHEFQAWLVAPPGRPRGAVVVLQEIFGVNAHIRAVAEDFAAQGYTSIAPSLFDRVRRGIQLGYGPADIEQGRGTMQQLDPAATAKDIAAAIAVVRNSGRTATVGYCWGGTQSWLAACEQRIAAAVVYYGKLARVLDRQPRCAVLAHFGELDRSIPLAEVEQLRAAHPQLAVHVYPGADHGFNCDQRPTFNAEAAALARRRTLDFLAEHLAGEEHTAS